MWQLYGQEHILRQLEPALAGDHLSHAYLLVGPPHVGKMTLALNLAQSVNCLEGPGIPCGNCIQCTRIASGLHADVRIVSVGNRETGGETDGGSTPVESSAGSSAGSSEAGRQAQRTVIGIKDVKDALHQVNLKPFEGSRIVVIFDGAESLSEEAANALLKSLEEPPPQVIVLLLTTNEDTLPPTVISRCQRLVLLPLAKDRLSETLVAGHQAGADETEHLARLSRGCLGWAISALKDPQILEQREAELDRLKEACEAGLSLRFGYASELATLFSRDRESAIQLLYLWLRWWRDLMLIKEGVQEYVTNSDQLNELSLQATQLTTGRIVQAIKNLNYTVEALEHNANPRLTLEAMMVGLPRVSAK
ncbi:MAG: hypothetical protein BZY88_18115 [SAR202 cluster bacterium Io17-Chloro-G9]|nr:MAG: hypothetical protein BZY88_18115 [SAR202 cluster bacterium Io17-Chloro-G9]